MLKSRSKRPTILSLHPLFSFLQRVWTVVDAFEKCSRPPIRTLRSPETRVRIESISSGSLKIDVKSVPERGGVRKSAKK